VAQRSTTAASRSDNTTLEGFASIAVMYNANPPQNQPGASGQQGPFLPRVDQIKTLPHLTAQQKESYEDGVKKLWDTINSNPYESPEHQTARKRLEHVGTQIKLALKKWQTNMNQVKQEGGRAPGQIQQQTQQQPNQGIRGPPSTQVSLAPQIVQHLAQFQFIIPPNIPPDTPESQKWLSEAKIRYGQALQKLDAARSGMATLEQRRQAAAEGKTLSQEDQLDYQQKKATFMKTYTDAKAFVDVFRKQQAEFRAQAQQRTQGAAGPQMGQGGNSGAGAGSGNRGPQQTPPITAQHLTQQPQIPPGQVANTHSVNSTVESVRSQSTTTISPSSAGPQSQLGQAPQPAQGPTSQGQMRNSNGGGVPINSQQQQTPQQRDSPQSAQPPQSATQTGPPRPLSHQAAMEQAQRNYANGPTSAAPTSNNHHAHPTPRDITTPKMPIPKNLSIPPPTPVSMGPARPTLAGGPSGTNNVMGQPALPRQPGYVLEGEGERVLSKKKLDELVRQVTGGGEGLGGEGLSAEVEEVRVVLVFSALSLSYRPLTRYQFLRSVLPLCATILLRIKIRYMIACL
jgi:transcription initiation factor TFIID subunit 12